MPEDLREETAWGLAAFFVGEERVTNQFSGLVLAAEDKHQQAFLITQRHEVSAGRVWSHCWGGRAVVAGWLIVPSGPSQTRRSGDSAVLNVEKSAARAVRLHISTPTVLMCGWAGVDAKVSTFGTARHGTARLGSQGVLGGAGCP